MDLRNVVFAIALSFAVLFGWSVIFETPQIEEQKKLEQTQGLEKTDNKNTDAPSPNVNIEKERVLNISRDDAIKSVKRVNFENENVKGSISLKGFFLIDDILFKKYNTEVNSDDKVKYLNPSQTNDGYFVETGWAASNITNTLLPTKNSIWKVVGNNKLSVGNPVTAEWNNKSGLTFRKRIELDEKFLFKVTQEVQNNSSQRVELYPYAQITRNQDPDVVDFYILHEGFIGVFDEDLQEEGYDDVLEKKKEYSAGEGWLGITDKYWLTALVPEKNQPFKGEFTYKNGFKANYIQNKPVVIQPSGSGISESKVFIAAKEVKVIDGYAETEGINKFDLTIDWGWFYFFH